jgi:small subunit ribosomal protein S21
METPVKNSYQKNFKKGGQLKNYAPLEVKVINNDVEQALKVLKKKMQGDNIFKILRDKRSYEKPSEKKRRKRRENARRLRDKK